MNKLQIKTDNPNYLAKVVKLPQPRPIPGADKLVVVTIDCQNIVTSKDAREGEIYIYCPPESALNKDYLSWSNSFAETGLNNDKTIKGFFGPHGRVRTIRLRNQASEGFIFPAKSLEKWAKVNGEKICIDESCIGVEFSHVGDILFIEKYINLVELRKLHNIESYKRKTIGKVKRERRLIDNQFRLHCDTLNIKRYVSNINPDDYISVTEKIHGSNGVFGKVLVKKELKIHEKILKFFGIKILDFKYDLIYSSRTRIRNEYADKKTTGFYDSDIWRDIATKLEPFIKNGITIYAEIFGQTKTGSWVQNNYDYRVPPFEVDYNIFRITYTSFDGDVYEFTHEQVVRYCAKYGLKMVPVHYYGKAKDLFPELDVQNHWHENFVNKLMETYTGGNCKLCNNPVPREGVVIRRANEYFDALKLKGINFLERETALADANNIDIETQESIEANFR